MAKTLIFMRNKCKLEDRSRNVFFFNTQPEEKLMEVRKKFFTKSVHSNS